MHLKTDTSSSTSHFAQVPVVTKPRSTFSIAKKHLTTFNFDYLYPAYVKMMMPGDTINIKHFVMSRLQTQVVTLFDDLYIDVHAWFVPFRLIQDNWARFQFNAQPGGPSQNNSSLTTPGILNVGQPTGPTFAAKSLYDYMGYPTGRAFTGSEDWLHNYYARAYNFIWNENYRDENLQAPVAVPKNDGPDDPSQFVLLRRGRRFDKFSSSLPWPYKGTYPFDLPFTTPGTSVVPVSRVPNAPSFDFMQNGTNTLAPNGPATFSGGKLIANGFSSVSVDPLGGGLQVDLATAFGVSINTWRASVAAIHLMEADARGGTRDVEALLHRWGVVVPDFRLQRPEFLAGATFTFDGHVVPQTSASEADSPQATLTQFSQSMSALSINHSFQEHGCLMILISHRSNLTYQQGLSREKTYKTRLDFVQPEFVNIGEVLVYANEIDYRSQAIRLPWGYQEYGYEMRYDDNMVSAEMKSDYVQSLDAYHMADDPATQPVMNSAWIQSSTPIDRNIAVAQSVSDSIRANMYTSGSISRCLPMYSVPGLMRI